jgi:hypothetical protein
MAIFFKNTQDNSNRMCYMHNSERKLVLKLEQALNESVLQESFPKYTLAYKGTREHAKPPYHIHDPNPVVLCIDAKYNPDKKGESILGINLNYIKKDGKDADKLVKEINKHDNKKFLGFEGLLKVKKFLKTKDVDEYESTKRQDRYKWLTDQFPEIKPYIRRYKYDGSDTDKDGGIKSQSKKGIFGINHQVKRK